LTDHFAGASIPTQWYCPPDVGAIDESSPSDAAVASVPKKQMMKLYTSEAGPPLTSPPCNNAARGSHVAIKVVEKPTIDMKPKLRCH